MLPVIKIIEGNNFMSKEKLIKQTLTLPSEMPLFNYNINFQGLRSLLERVNVQTNNNSQSITQLQQQLETKATAQQLIQVERKLNDSFLLGSQCQNYVRQQEEKLARNSRTNPKELSPLDQYCYKVNRLAEVVEYLFQQSMQHGQQIGSDSRRTQKLIEDSVKRVDDKVTSVLDSNNTTLHSFFKQTNEKVSKMESDHNTLKLNYETKIAEMDRQMAKRVSEAGLKTHLNAHENKVKQQLQGALKTDHMQRLATVQQMKTAFKEAQKDQEHKNKVMSVKMQQLSEKVGKAMLTTAFDIEKHKIFERLSELKHKADELTRKNGQFVEFRKHHLTQTEKTKQDMIELNQEIKKLNNKETTFKKIQNVSDLLKNFSPHLICQMTEQLKLHEKQIGSLQKKILNFEAEMRRRDKQKPMPEVNGGQNSDLIQKIIKQFMSNMDFESRVKRSEKEIQDLKRKNDGLAQMQKKIYMLSKEVDMTTINKQLRKKCDQENTRKDIKILDGKVDQLFEFFKQVRRDMEEKRRVAPKSSDPFDNASLTTKKLMSANCLSCNPSTPSTRRQYTRNKLELSVDYGIEGHKNTIYSRQGK